MIVKGRSGQLISVRDRQNLEDMQDQWRREHRAYMKPNNQQRPVKATASWWAKAVAFIKGVFVWLNHWKTLKFTNSEK